MNKFDLSNHVVQSNDLITSKWKMDRTSLKLFEMAVAALDTSKESPSREVVLKKDDIFKMFKASGSDKYTRFEGHLKDLIGDPIKIEFDDNMVGLIMPITSVRWSKKDTDQRVIIVFNELIMPYLVELKGRFTSYKIENLVDLTSKYAIIIYKLAKMNSWQGHECKYSIKDLREITDTVKTHPRFEVFERKVLKQAMKEINEGHTDIVMTYEKIKEGTRIVGITFKSRVRLSHRDTDYDNPKPIRGLTDEDVTMSFDDIGWK